MRENHLIPPCCTNRLLNELMPHLTLSLKASLYCTHIAHVNIPEYHSYSEIYIVDNKKNHLIYLAKALFVIT